MWVTEPNKCVEIGTAAHIPISFRLNLLTFLMCNVKLWGRRPRGWDTGDACNPRRPQFYQVPEQYLPKLCSAAAKHLHPRIYLTKHVTSFTPICLKHTASSTNRTIILQTSYHHLKKIRFSWTQSKIMSKPHQKNNLTEKRENFNFQFDNREVEPSFSFFWTITDKTSYNR